MEDASCERGVARCGVARCGVARFGDARCGDAEMRRCGDAEMRRCGDSEMRDARCGDSRFEIRDSRFEIRDSEIRRFGDSEIRDARFEMRDAEIRDARCEMRRFEIRDSRFEIRDSRFEIRDARGGCDLESTGGAGRGGPRLQSANLLLAHLESHLSESWRQPSSSAKPGRLMVWTRSGPVEIIPILAPDCSSMKVRYSCAFFGSLS
jgi:hypothetical protein